MRNRKMIWGAVAAACLCLAGAMGGAAVAGVPETPSVALAPVPASDVLVLDAVSTAWVAPAAVVAYRAELLTEHAALSAADRTLDLTEPDVAADLAPTMATYAVYLPPAASLRPRPGWRWSV